jgi:transposase
MKQINTLNFAGQTFYIGIDVHSTNWKVTIRSNGLKLHTTSIDPNPVKLKEYMQARYPEGTYNSVYEAGFSGYWAHRELEKLGFNNIIVNPADVPTTDKEKDCKNDPIDSNKLSRELSNGSLKGIFVPDLKQESVRVLSRSLRQYSQRSTQIKNRIKGLLYFLGLKCEGDSSKHWSAAYLKELSEIIFPDENDQFTMECHLEELTHVRRMKTKILKRIHALAKDNPVLCLLRTIPGIGITTAFTLYAELIDIKRFADLDHLSSFVGLVPSTASSNNKTIIRGMTNRHSRYLRYMLIEAAWIAVRKDPVLMLSYSNLLKGKMKKTRAIVKIAKKLLNRIRAVWKNMEEYKPDVVETDRNTKKVKIAKEEVQRQIVS